MSILVDLVFSGMIAFAVDDPRSEVMAIIPRSEGGHHDVMVHHPYLSFVYEDLRKINGKICQEGNPDGPDAIDCAKFLDDLLGDEDLPGKVRENTRKIPLAPGYDINIKGLKRNSLTRLNCEAMESVDGMGRLCDGCRGVGNSGFKLKRFTGYEEETLCDFSFLLPMAKIAPGAEKVEDSLFEVRLSEEDRERIAARIMMTEGLAGAILDSRFPSWKFKTSPWNIVYVQDVAATEVGWRIPLADASSVTVIMTPHKPWVGRLELTFSPLLAGPVRLTISNHPRKSDFCEENYRGVFGHFRDYYSLSEAFCGKQSYPRSKYRVKAACKIIDDIVQGGGGRYPVICLALEMEGQELPEF